MLKCIDRWKEKDMQLYIRHKEEKVMHDYHIKKDFYNVII
jgi:hypothetical protein